MSSSAPNTTATLLLLPRAVSPAFLSGGEEFWPGEGGGGASNATGSAHRPHHQQRQRTGAKSREDARARATLAERAGAALRGTFIQATEDCVSFACAAARSELLSSGPSEVLARGVLLQSESRLLTLALKNSVELIFSSAKTLFAMTPSRSEARQQRQLQSRLRTRLLRLCERAHLATSKVVSVLAAAAAVDTVWAEAELRPLPSSSPSPSSSSLPSPSAPSSEKGGEGCAERKKKKKKKEEEEAEKKKESFTMGDPAFPWKCLSEEGGRELCLLLKIQADFLRYQVEATISTSIFGSSGEREVSEAAWIKSAATEEDDDDADDDDEDDDDKDGNGSGVNDDQDGENDGGDSEGGDESTASSCSSYGDDNRCKAGSSCLAASTVVAATAAARAVFEGAEKKTTRVKHSAAQAALSAAAARSRPPRLALAGEVAAQAKDSYLEALDSASVLLSPIDPVLLAVALNFSSFLHETLLATRSALAVARNAFDNAVSCLASLSKDAAVPSESVIILDLLQRTCQTLERVLQEG